MSKEVKNKLKSFLQINIGVFLAAVSVQIFLSPNNVTGGGLSGVAILIEDFLPSFMSLPLFILCVNVILLSISFFAMGKDYFLKTCCGALIYPIYLSLIEKFMSLFSEGAWDIDMYLVVIFGAVVMGAGMGITMRNGGTTGGGDIIQSIMFKHFKIPMSKTMYVFDGTLVILSILVFKDLSLALATITYILITGVVLDSVVFGGFNKRCVYIISKKNDDIRKYIMHELVRGTTNFSAYGGYNNEEKDVIICLLSTKEYFELRHLVEEIDPHAFMFVTRATEVRGFGFSLESPARALKGKRREKNEEV